MRTLKWCPEFDRLHSNTHLILGSCTTAAGFLRSKGMMDRVSGFLGRSINGQYTDEFHMHFNEAVAQAVPYVADRMDRNTAVQVALRQYLSEGEHCVAIIIEGRPRPGLEVHLDDVHDPFHLHPDMTNRQYPEGALTHALIMRNADGYAVCFAPERVLRLNLVWYEPAR